MTQPDWRLRSRPSTLRKVVWLLGVFLLAVAVSFVFMVVIPGR